MSVRISYSHTTESVQFRTGIVFEADQFVVWAQFSRYFFGSVIFCGGVFFETKNCKSEIALFKNNKDLSQSGFPLGVFPESLTKLGIVFISF